MWGDTGADAGEDVTSNWTAGGGAGRAALHSRGCSSSAIQDFVELGLGRPTISLKIPVQYQMTPYSVLAVQPSAMSAFVNQTPSARARRRDGTVPCHVRFKLPLQPVAARSRHAPTRQPSCTSPYLPPNRCSIVNW